MQSSALTENHTRHKKDTLEQKKSVAEHAEHIKNHAILFNTEFTQGTKEH